MDIAVEQTTFHVGQEVRAKKNLYDDLREHGMGEPLYANRGDRLVIREVSNSGKSFLVSHNNVENKSFRVSYDEIEAPPPSFGDHLLATRGFENPYLVEQLAIANTVSLMSDLAQTLRNNLLTFYGADSMVLRCINTVVNEIGATAMALVQWRERGPKALNGCEVKTIDILSLLKPAMGLSKDQVVIASIMVIEALPDKLDDIDLTEAEYEYHRIQTMRRSIHPVGVIINRLVTQVIQIANREANSLKYHGRDDRYNPTSWYFTLRRDGTAFKTLTIEFKLHVDLLEEELRLLDYT